MKRFFLYAVPLALAGCASAPRQPAVEPIAWPEDSPAVQLQVLNRVSWGANRSAAADIARLGSGGWLSAQLQPGSASLPPEIQARIDEMAISRRSLVDLGSELERRRLALQKA